MGEIDFKDVILIISLLISLTSLIVSLIVLYFNFLKKKKPLLLLPEHIFIGYIKDRLLKSFPIVSVPISIINQGARNLTITKMQLLLNKNNIDTQFKWFMKSKEMIKPPEMTYDIKKEGYSLVAPYIIKKYSSKTEMISFIFLKRSDSFFDIMGDYVIKLSVYYDIEKVITISVGFKMLQSLFNKIKTHEVQSVFIQKSIEEEVIWEIK